jgi:hypothetical protein
MGSSSVFGRAAGGRRTACGGRAGAREHGRSVSDRTRRRRARAATARTARGPRPRCGSTRRTPTRGVALEGSVVRTTPSCVPRTGTTTDVRDAGAGRNVRTSGSSPLTRRCAGRTGRVTEVSAVTAPIAIARRGPPGEDAPCSGRCSSRSGRAAVPTPSTVLSLSTRPAACRSRTRRPRSTPRPVPCSPASAHPGSPGVRRHSRPPAAASAAPRCGSPACPAPGSPPSRTAASPRCAPGPARRGARRRRGPPAPRRGPRLLPRRPRHQHPRIGWVAELLARNGVLVLVSAIAPFRDVRDQVRAAHEANGTPLPGGARQHPGGGGVGAGRQGPLRPPARGRDLRLTGVDDPYEEPLAPDPRHRRRTSTPSRSRSRCCSSTSRARGLDRARRPGPRSRLGGVRVSRSAPAGLPAARAPKCGTSALHAALARHPRLFLSEPKEPKFFLTDGPPPRPGGGPGDVPTWGEHVWRRDEYEALFAAACPGAVRRVDGVLPLRPRRAGADPQLLPGAPADRRAARPGRAGALELGAPARRGPGAEADFAPALDREPERIAAGWAHFWHYAAMGATASSSTTCSRCSPASRCC